MKIFLTKNGQQDGPYAIDHISKLLEEGKIRPGDPAFFDGCSDWSTVSEIPGVSQVLEEGSSFGQYKVIRRLGQGGMGEVYEVAHEVLGTRHALKLLSTEVMEVHGALERFEREAKVMAGLKHPGIVAVDDFGETDNRYWLRMELMEGRELNGHKIVTLEEYVRAKGGRLAEEEAKRIIEEILLALAHAHDNGLIHQDLKPANILFDGEKLKISDFGLVNAAGAEWMNPQAQDTVVSESGQEEDTIVESSATSPRLRAIMGTLSFMSPEQKLGKTADRRSDLFAIGLIAFRLFTHKTPGFKAPSKMVEGLSTGWDDWLQKALEHDPTDRFAHAKEMAKALDFPDDGSSSSEPTNEPEKTLDVATGAAEVSTKPQLISDGPHKSVAKFYENVCGLLKNAKLHPFISNLSRLKESSQLGKKNFRDIKKGKLIAIAAGVIGLFAVMGTLLLFGGKAPDNPEDLAVEALDIIVDENLDAYLSMTNATLDLSQWEKLLKDVSERKISYLEEEMEKASEKSEKRKIEDDIDEWKQLLEYDIGYISYSNYLSTTLDELDYEKWKSLREDRKTSQTISLEERIENIEDSQKVAVWKKTLNVVESQTFGKSDYNEWKENQEDRGENWNNAMQKIRKTGKDLGINWQEVSFEYSHFDKDLRESIDPYKLEITFSYREKNYKIDLGKCQESPFGILLTGRPGGPIAIEI